MGTQLNANETNTGAATNALMGAAAGAIGVWALDRTDWFMWNRLDDKTRAATVSVRPGGEPPAHVFAGKIENITGLTPTETQHAIAGKITHYSIGIAPAAGYALVRDKLPGQGPMRGLLYGLGVFLLQDEVLNTLSGLGAKPRAYPWQAHARGLVAHLVYGLVTELALSAMQRSVNSARSSRTATSNYQTPDESQSSYIKEQHIKNDDALLGSQSSGQVQRPSSASTH